MVTCRLAVIFRGQGKVKTEKRLYHPAITVLWQAKVWNDAKTQLAYDDLVLIPELKAAGVGTGQSDTRWKAWRLATTSVHTSKLSTKQALRTRPH